MSLLHALPLRNGRLLPPRRLRHPVLGNPTGQGGAGSLRPLTLQPRECFLGVLYLAVNFDDVGEQFILTHDYAPFLAIAASALM